MQILGYLPLAISQAASYISYGGVPWSEYLRLLACEIEKRTDKDRSSLAALQMYPRSVYQMWEINFGELETRDPPAAYLLRLCSYFACENIPVEMLFLGFRSRKIKT